MSTTLETAVGAGELVGAFFDSIARRDISAAFAHVSPEVSVTIEPAQITGGYDDARAFFEQATEAFPDLMLPVRTLAEFPDGRVLAELTFEGTQARDFLGVLNQEKHIDIEQAWLFDTAAGRIAAIAGYWDQIQLYRRLGVKRLDQIGIAS
jgi:ketosteroid isomerase-like protein